MITWPLLVLLAIPAVDVVDATTLVDEQVVVIDGSPARGRLVEVALRARGLRLLDDAERPGLDGPDTRPAVGDREVVRGRLLAARAALRQFELDAATAAVDEAAREMLRLESPENHAELLVDILLMQASLQLGRGAPDEARRAVLLATRLEPQRATLDAALHAPSLVEAWAAARSDDASDDASAVIVVRPRVIGGGAAEVMVDGRPAAVRAGLLELRRGPHLVTMRAPGCRAVSRLIDVGTGGGTAGEVGEIDDVAIEDVLIPDGVIAARQALVATVLGGDRPSLQALREQADVDVIVAIDDSASGGIWAQRGAAPAVRLDVAHDAAADVIADAVVRSLAPRLATTPPVAGAGVDADDGATWWLVGGSVGAAVLVGGAAVVTWALWPGEAPPPPARPITLIGIVL